MKAKLQYATLGPPHRHQSADASAVHYMNETAKPHGLEPYGYLNAIFKALPYAKKVEGFEVLLLWNFKTLNLNS